MFSGTGISEHAFLPQRTEGVTIIPPEMRLFLATRHSLSTHLAGSPINCHLRVLNRYAY
jgi:hypothetical protein